MAFGMYPRAKKTQIGDMLSPQEVQATRRLDWPLVLCVAALCAFGLVLIFSATSSGGRPFAFLVRQFAALILGAVACSFIVQVNYRILRTYAMPFFLFGLLLLALVLLAGTTVRGSRSWFNLGPFSFQPSELAKIVLVLVLASFLDTAVPSRRSYGPVLACIGVTMSFMLLVVVEPDISSSIVFLPILFGMVYASGLATRELVLSILFLVLSTGIGVWRAYVQFKAPESAVAMLFTIPGFFSYLAASAAAFSVAWYFLQKMFIRISFKRFIEVWAVAALALGCVSTVFGHLKQYQQLRVASFIDSNLDPLGSGYNVIQSMIAIGSGGLFGKGLFNGTQTHLGFVPEQHTDFIFSVLGEELGAVFAFLVIGIYFLLVLRGLQIAERASDRFGRLVATGFSCMFAYYGLMNVAMVTGMMPVTGVPLPFMSYGGSSLVTNLCAVGLLLSVRYRQFAN